MSDLTVVVPSRGRPQAVTELAAAFEATATSSPLLVFSLDEDDPALGQYLAAIRDRQSWVDVAVAPNANMAEALNHAARGTDGFAVAFMGDDHRPRTYGWDAVYLDALRVLGTGIVYGDDLLQRENLPTQVAMTTDIVRTLGWMTPPGLRHMYLDNFWRDLGAAAGCLRYLPDVVVEHMHPVAGKAQLDEGYERVNAPEMYEHDRRAYNLYLAGEFRADAAKIRALRGAHV